MKKTVVFFIILAFTFSRSMEAIEFVRNDAKQKVDVMIDGKLFTSYIYSDKYEKPALFPVNAPNGTTVTRGFPINPRPGDRVDHPHHIGIWFNYGNVNGLDFWNNSTAIPADKKQLYGAIRHREIISTRQNLYQQGIEMAELITTNQWTDINNNILINEETTYTFAQYGGIWAVMRTTKLTANKNNVTFGDSKEGLFAIRYCREFEDKKDVPKQLLNANLMAVDTVVKDNSIATGIYHNSEGLSGADVWGKPTQWLSLSGIKDGEKISMAMIEHKSNPGYPAHSHARGYGLFAINDLGSSSYGDFPESKLILEAGKSLTFKHLFVIKAKENFQPEEMSTISDFFNEY